MGGEKESAWVLDGVNPTWLFARYKSGGHFSPHTDGTTIFDFNKRTLYTIIIYLNDTPGDGHTRLFDDKQIWQELK